VKHVIYVHLSAFLLANQQSIILPRRLCEIQEWEDKGREVIEEYMELFRQEEKEKKERESAVVDKGEEKLEGKALSVVVGEDGGRLDRDLLSVATMVTEPDSLSREGAENDDSEDMETFTEVNNKKGKPSASGDTQNFLFL